MPAPQLHTRATINLFPNIHASVSQPLRVKNRTSDANRKWKRLSTPPRPLSTPFPVRPAHRTSAIVFIYPSRAPRRIVSSGGTQVAPGEPATTTTTLTTRPGYDRTCAAIDRRECEKRDGSCCGGVRAVKRNRTAARASHAILGSAARLFVLIRLGPRYPVPVPQCWRRVFRAGRILRALSSRFPSLVLCCSLTAEISRSIKFIEMPARSARRPRRKKSPTSTE